MRRKTSSNNGPYNNNQPRKPRFQQGGSNGGEHRSHNAHHNNGGHGRPRKNYVASREKYLAQARDALSAGDRVLAENYFQHAEHCYRMMVEEGYLQRNTFTPSPQADDAAQQQARPDEQDDANPEQGDGSDATDAGINQNQLPAFLTVNYEQSAQEKAAEPVIVPTWEE